MGLSWPATSKASRTNGESGCVNRGSPLDQWVRATPFSWAESSTLRIIGTGSSLSVYRKLMVHQLRATVTLGAESKLSITMFQSG